MNFIYGWKTGLGQRIHGRETNQRTNREFIVKCIENILCTDILGAKPQYSSLATNCHDPSTELYTSWGENFLCHHRWDGNWIER